MLPLFIAEMEKDAATLQALAAAPLADLAEHAHAMRGKCAMFGEDILFGLLTRLEQDCLAGTRETIAPLIALVAERALQLCDAVCTVPEE